MTGHCSGLDCCLFCDIPQSKSHQRSNAADTESEAQADRVQLFLD